MCRSRRELSNEDLLAKVGLLACLLASIQPRTSLVKFPRSPRTDPPGFSNHAHTGHGSSGAINPAQVDGHVIEMKNMSYRYAEGLPVALKDCSFSFGRGARVLLIGANGSCKSTAMSRRAAAGRAQLLANSGNCGLGAISESCKSWKTPGNSRRLVHFLKFW